MEKGPRQAPNSENGFCSPREVESGQLKLGSSMTWHTPFKSVCLTFWTGPQRALATTFPCTGRQQASDEREVQGVQQAAQDEGL